MWTTGDSYFMWACGSLLVYSLFMVWLELLKIRQQLETLNKK